MSNFDDLFFVIASIIILIGVMLMASRVRLNMMVFLVVNLSTVLIGLILLESENSTVVAYGVSIIALIIGYSIAVSAGPRKQPSHVRMPTKSLPDHVVYSIVAFAGGLGVYHLIVGGIPIFSSSIETKRFDFTSSGLFGLPGRMFLYGIPFAWMIASANAQARNIRWRTYIPWRLATFFLVATALMSGFKSGLLAATYTMLIAYFIISQDRTTLGVFARKYWWAFSAPVLYGLSVATSYSTYDVAGQPLWSQLLRRVTVVGAQPVQYAMDGRVSNQLENGLWNDLVYFIAKYGGGETSRMFSLERSISADIIGADPSSSAWTTPVTLGGFAEIAYSFGAYVALALMILIGALIGRLHRGTSSGAASMSLSAIAAFAIYNWLLKGGLIYYVLNVAAVVVILMMVGSLAWFLSPRERNFGPTMTQPSLAIHPRRSGTHKTALPTVYRR